MRRRAVLGGILGAAAASDAFAQAPQRTHSAAMPWPTQDWSVGPLPDHLDRPAFDLAVTDAFAGGHPLMGETRAVLVVQGGRILFERYGDDYGRDMRLTSWSMAKSITQALVGCAVLQGAVAVDTPMGNPHWPAGDRRASITWRQFLQQVDGLDYQESAQNVAEAGNARMLFGDGRLDTAAWAANLRLAHDPGSHWNYTSAGTLLIADALTRAVVPDPRDVNDRRARMLAWMRASLFDKIGMHPVVEFDPRGLFYGSSLIWATARDFARFGYLYLRNGVWNGQRVLPEGWVDFARTPGPAQNTDTYGAQWWLQPQSGTGRPTRALLTDPSMRDAYSAQGYEGQIIVVVPSRDIVMVRLGKFDGGLEAWDALGDWATRLIGSFGALRP
ncbi:serine hydrolase domain-containing protein [Terricaulis sp.]|uniref:serine hydrolase domain-containing protein n=1 Tax=Terricaulis sp. TaxID=2768686 RepID=UPI003783D70F